MLKKFFLGIILISSSLDLPGQNFAGLRQEELGDEAAWIAAIQDVQSLASSEVQESDVLAIDELLDSDNVRFRGQLFLIAGWLGRRDALLEVDPERLSSVSEQNNYQLALIRSGNLPSLSKLDALLETIVVDDRMLYYVAPKLIYTRNRTVINFFLNEILTDQFNCRSPDPHSSQMVNCAYRLLELVSPVIEDFPIGVKPSGDLDVDDYTQALLEARIWIRENMYDYEILNEKY